MNQEEGDAGETKSGANNDLFSFTSSIPSVPISSLRNIPSHMEHVGRSYLQTLNPTRDIRKAYAQSGSLSCGFLFCVEVRMTQNTPRMSFVQGTNSHCVSWVFGNEV